MAAAKVLLLDILTPAAYRKLDDLRDGFVERIHDTLRRLAGSQPDVVRPGAAVPTADDDEVRPGLRELDGADVVADVRLAGQLDRIGGEQGRRTMLTPAPPAPSSATTSPVVASKP